MAKQPDPRESANPQWPWPTTVGAVSLLIGIPFVLIALPFVDSSRPIGSNPLLMATTAVLAWCAVWLVVGAVARVIDAIDRHWL